MKRSTTRWTTAMAAAALIALPAVGSAQPPSPTQTPSPAAQTPTATPQTESTAQTPADHIKLAKSALDSVSKQSLPADARSKIDELNRHLDSLEGEASSGAATSATATETQKWQTDLASAKQVLADLIGPESAAASEPTGTTGGATIDEATKDNLRTVREQLNKFAEAMNRGPESAPSASPATEPSTQPPTTEPSTPPTTEPSTPPTTEPTPPTTEPSAQPPTTEPGAQPPAGAAPQGDEQAARQHLSAAREALSQVTSMPEAQQLQGEARTQVSQLISNFNELITAEANWPAAYAKVEANLTTLLGPAGSDESAQQPAAPTAAPESGAVGTTGASAVQIDPKVRAKLQEVRQQLKQFEQAAGGATGTPAATPNPSASTPSPSSPAGTYPTSPSTTPPSATEPSMAQSGQAGAGQQAEIQRHLDAIASIVNQALGSSAPSGAEPSTTEPGQPTGTSGSQTISLDRAQLEQIKTHLDQIQELLRQSGR